MTDETTTNPEAAPETTPVPEAKKSTHQMSFTVLENGEIRAEFGPGLEPLTCNPALLAEELLPLALSEGVTSRLRTFTSRLTGENRTPENLRLAIEAGIKALFTDKVWKTERTAGESFGAISIEAEASHIFRVKRAAQKGEEFTGTLEQSAKDFAALPDEKKKQLKEVPLFKVAYAEVKAQRAAANAAKLAKTAAAMGDDSIF